jgi:hypothetical protein
MKKVFLAAVILAAIVGARPPTSSLYAIPAPGSEDGIPGIGFGTALQLPAMNAAGTALEWVASTGTGNILRSTALTAGVLNWQTSGTLLVTGQSSLAGAVFTTGGRLQRNGLQASAATSDAVDNSFICGGGGGDEAITRGAFWCMYGNEAATTGGWAQYFAGNVTGGRHLFYVGNSDTAMAIRSDSTKFYAPVRFNGSVTILGLAGSGNRIVTTGSSGNLGISSSITGANTWGDVQTFTSAPRFNGGNTTGAGTALLGTNSPAVTVAAPYTWITVTTNDGSTAFIPAWK